MSAKDTKRKLTAILSADVQGYSRLMGDDERATVETITAYRKVMTDLTQDHHGRVVDAKGDNVLAEFPSVVDAIQCAVEMQKELSIRDADLPDHRRMEFRIGINLGDVIEKEETIYGDGVNVAARLESLAEGGGICISGTAFDQIGKKVPLGYEYLGEQTVKNIEKPIRVYRALVDPESVGKVVGEKRRLRKWHWAAFGGLAILIVVGALAFWNFYLRPDMKPASIEKMAYPLPDKPSIAVLPFVNMSDEPEQEYFSDGLTEEIITTLSKVPQLFVIARNSTFAYKGKSIKVQQIGQELGVRYVLEGSVRKVGERVRITAQLIDASTGGHIWSERYDRDLKDIFALQDEITLEILTAVRVKLTDGEQARLYDRAAQNLDSYMKVLQGMPYFYSFNKEGNVRARQIFEEAIALDSQNAAAYTMLAWTHTMDVWLGLSDSPAKSIERVTELVQKALALNDPSGGAHSLLGSIYLMNQEYEKAIAEAERATALNPNGADAHAHLGMILNYAGRPKEAIVLLEKAIRLNPIPPNWYLFSLGDAYGSAGRHEEAIAVYKRELQRNPKDMRALMGLAATYILLGREEEARAQTAKILKLEPRLSLEHFAKTLPHKNKADKDLIIDSLRKAGLK